MDYKNGKTTSRGKVLVILSPQDVGNSISGDLVLIIKFWRVGRQFYTPPGGKKQKKTAFFQDFFVFLCTKNVDFDQERDIGHDVHRFFLKPHHMS